MSSEPPVFRSVAFIGSSLPPLLSNSSGIAYPKPGANVASCPVLVATKMETPWGQELDADAGTIHIAQDGEGDSYPNMEFEDFYEVGDVMDPEDPRAAYLINYWAERGHVVEPRLATKTKPAIVVGVVDESAYGSTFENHEGATPLEAGLILQSPADANVQWFIRQAVFEKKYACVEVTSKLERMMADFALKHIQEHDGSSVLDVRLAIERYIKLELTEQAGGVCPRPDAYSNGVIHILVKRGSVIVENDRVRVNS